MEAHVSYMYDEVRSKAGRAHPGHKQGPHLPVKTIKLVRA